MSRLFNYCAKKGLFLSVLIFSGVMGISLFYAPPASAYSVGHSYTLYEKSGNYLYYNVIKGTFEIIGWSPRVNIAEMSSCGGVAGDRNLISTEKYTDCIGLTINEVGSPARNDNWFEEARYSFVISDFDHTETISVSGGYIYDWGSSTSTVNASRQFARSKAGATAGQCDTPNYKTTDDCSVLILFDPSYSGDFSITLDNDANSPTHEYVYSGPENGLYRTLTFNPNGGSVADTTTDEATIWPHMSGTNLLREYTYNATANEYPTPIRKGYIFLGWYDAISGGNRITSRMMSNDITLYAHWQAGYTLVPSVILSKSIIEAGESFNVTPAIVNSGDGPSPTVNCNLVKTIANPFATGATTNGSGTFPANSGPTSVLAYTEYSTNYPAGTRICFVLSVSPYTYDDPSGVARSTSVCVIIGKKPKVQVWGGDLWVRGNIQTSSSVKSGKIYGSWSEYGLFAGGTITGMASGSAFNNGLASALTNTCNYSSLTFSNTQSTNATTCENGDVMGGYDTVSRLIPDVASSFPTSSAIGSVSGTVALGGLSSGVYRAGLNNITINGSVLPSNKWIVLNVPSKNVTINGNISYTPNTLHKLDDIPQLVIIAKSITINSDVTNIDAWLIANNKDSKDGFIKTCEIVGNTINKCNKPLTINGPVMTDKLYLYRTAGSGTGVNSGEPAEIINLRADAYLWAYNRVSGRGKVQTVYTKELPPRF